MNKIILNMYKDNNEHRGRLQTHRLKFIKYSSILFQTQKRKKLGIYSCQKYTSERNGEGADEFDNQLDIE